MRANILDARTVVTDYTIVTELELLRNVELWNKAFFKLSTTSDTDLSKPEVVRIHMLGPLQSTYPSVFAESILNKLKEELSSTSPF